MATDDFLKVRDAIIRDYQKVLTRCETTISTTTKVLRTKIVK